MIDNRIKAFQKKNDPDLYIRYFQADIDLFNLSKSMHYWKKNGLKLIIKISAVAFTLTWVRGTAHHYSNALIM